MSYYPPPPSNYPYHDYPYNWPPFPPFLPIHGFSMDQGFQGFPPPPTFPPMNSFPGFPGHQTSEFVPQNSGFSNPETLQITRFVPRHPGFQILQNPETAVQNSEIQEQEVVPQNPPNPDVLQEDVQDNLKFPKSEILEIPEDVTYQECQNCKDLKSEIQEIKEISEQNLDNVRNALFEEANASKEKDTVIQNLVEERDHLQLQLQTVEKEINEKFSSQQTVIENLEEKLLERIRVRGKKSKSSGSSDSEKLKIEIKNVNAGLRRQSDLLQVSRKENLELKKKLNEKNAAVQRLEERLNSVKEELQEQSDRNKSLEKYMNSQVPSEDREKIAELEARNSELVKELEAMKRIVDDEAPPAKVRKLRN
ncbi:hypothetical protein L3Y34_019314 [Caenorhabditis briggsae]|uniref:Uncharacterized protein n=1 Tax=Caenorhabditis briggsae TaxID=6238 RepID=A0AAE9DNC6_CAEBR|nr:hypothetical protein L3Y34_019314 [Caenorhabditis briggsae]